MIETTEEIQISETTVSFRISFDSIEFAETLDECYERKPSRAREEEGEQKRKSKSRADKIVVD